MVTKLKHIGVFVMMCCVFCLTACGAKSDEIPVMTDDLGMDVVGDVSFTDDTAETTAEFSITTRETEETTSKTEQTTTATSEVTTSAKETSMTTEKTTTSTSAVTSNAVTAPVVTSSTTAPTSITTVGTTSELTVSAIDVVAGTTQGETTGVSEVANEVTTGGLRDLSQTLNVKLNSGKAYWYDQFNEDESNAYEKLLSAVLKHKPSVTFDKAMTSDEYLKIFGILYGQNPELFWMSGKTKLSEDGLTATLFYTYDEKTSQGMQIVLDKRVKELLSMMTDDMTDLEKLLICHNYIVKFNSYSKETLHSSNAYGCLIDGKSQCSGYAKGLLYLCDQLDIPAIYVNGVSGETGNTHAWNQVFLEGHWYNVDCMWDDPEMEPEDKKNVSYRYMCVPDSAIMGTTHLYANRLQTDASLEYFRLPDCISYSENADIRYGVYATTYEEVYEKLKQGCIDAVKDGRYCAHVKVESTEVYKEALEHLIGNKEVYNIRKELNAIYGEGVVVGFGAAPENKLNYIEVTLKYGEGYAP